MSKLNQSTLSEEIMKKIIVLIIFLTSICFAQYGYWGHYLLDKGYEENPNFLMPHRTLTMEMEGIGKEMLGLFSDTLSNMSFNPAFLANISGNQLYIDFANQKPVDPIYNPYFPYYDYGVNSCFMPPYYQRISRREISPLLRAIGTYQSKKLPLKFALSYELIKYTGDYYENYSYGNYRYGVDAFNEKAYDASVDVPQIMSAGDDTKSKVSHMIDFFTAWKLSSAISTGLKLSYFSDNIEGKYRNFNRNNSYEYDYENYYDNMDSRDNKFEHYEITAGLNYKKDASDFGVSGGWIFGEDKQKRVRADTSYHMNDYPDYVDYECLYTNTNSVEYIENWKNSGNTGFVSINGSHRMQNFSILYRAEFLNNFSDITNNGISRDTSFYQYSNYYSEYHFNKNLSYSREERTGSGDISRTKSTVGISLQSNKKNKNFSIGLIYQQIDGDRKVVENSIDERFSKHFIELNQISRWKTQEQNIDLHFKSWEKITQMKIPVSFVFSSKNGWHLRTTLTKIIGSRESEEEILVNYNDFLYRDLIQNPAEEINEHKNELYIATPVKETIDRIQFRAYVECDFSENIKLFILFNDLFVSKGEEYRYYNNDSDFFNIGNWKFGVGFQF